MIKKREEFEAPGSAVENENPVSALGHHADKKGGRKARKAKQKEANAVKGLGFDHSNRIPVGAQ